ncbi:recombinase family protein [Mariniflexile gromovii]|uniref:Recombinase family protein n=1 Tax=Mariniflexile gromovii TaxID=362523 RepID=A0ABS4BXV9_9FLAO|nr:recombinase family protein [Mariniflexile gromovii]MBP0904872.1 recombinase family protein [Mariniflexile gromovii]
MLAVYSRISQLKEEGKDRSINDQKELGETKAKELNLQFKHYTDEGISGAGDTIEDRPALSQLLEDIISKQITAVFVIDESRLSRNPKTKYIIIDLFKDYNIITHSHIDGILDYSNPDTEFISEIKAVIHKRQVTETKIKLKLSLKRAVKEGKATNPVLKYGYKKDDNGFIAIDEEEAEIVKLMFKLSLKGIGTNKIAEALNDDGVPTRYAKTAKGSLTTHNKLTGITTKKQKKDVKWQQNTVRQIIKSTWYYGKRLYQGEYYDVPPILDKKYWQKVNDNLTANKTYSGKYTHKWLLKGLLKCECGCNMYGHYYEVKRENVYRCSSKRAKTKTTTNICKTRSINRPSIYHFIWNRFFVDKHLSNLVLKHFKNTDEKEMIDKLNNKLNELNHLISSIAGERKKTITLTIKGFITDEESERELKRIRTEQNDIETQILNLKEQIKTYENKLSSSKDISNELLEYKNKTSFNDKHYILNKYIKQIVVTDENRKYKFRTIEVYFNIPNIEPEVYLIDNGYNYALEPFEETLIPISEKFNDYSQNEINEMGRNTSRKFKEKMKNIIQERN